MDALRDSNIEVAPSPTRLVRRLGLAGAIAIGLGAMVGAGVFTVFAPAAQAAGKGLLYGLGIAAVVAYCNATSSAALAAIYPESGGTYVYGRKRLGAFWGFLAGWAFVVGKLASCAAMALVFGFYVSPSMSSAGAHSIAVVAVLVATAVNIAGIRKTAVATIVIVAVVLTCLAITVAAIGLGASTGPSWWHEGATVSTGNLYGVLQSAGFLFFAFAGYARLATLGEEVIDPRRTIPLAIPIALGITLVVYGAVALSLLSSLGATQMAESTAPLVTAVMRSGNSGWLVYVPRVGAVVGSFGVLLSLMVGVSRTVFAMANRQDLPHFFAAVHATRLSPHRAELAIGCLVALIAGCADVRFAIGFSSFAVMLYYAIGNASALTLTKAERRWPRALAVLGIAGCVALAATLPVGAVAGGVAMIGLGVVVYWLRPSTGASAAASASASASASKSVV